jgi:hypothetical protein
MFRWLDCVHRTPSLSQYWQNNPRMSADRLLKKYLGYAYSPTRPDGSVTLKRLMVRHPSEWIRPRRKG